MCKSSNAHIPVLVGVVVHAALACAQSLSFGLQFAERAVHPTWERFAEVMHDADKNLAVVVDREKREDPLTTTDSGEEEVEKAKKLKVPVLVAKLDCVEYEAYCDEIGIDGFPTLKLYVNGNQDMVSETYCFARTDSAVFCLC